MAEVTIKAHRNGPYEVSGDVTVLDFEGAAYPADPGAIYLCRCGRSATKPFCDGTHKKVGFQAEERVRTAAKAMARVEALIVAAGAAADNGFDIGVQHLAAHDVAEAFAEKVAGALGRERVPVDEISAVLGAHTGPGTVSVSLTPR